MGERMVQLYKRKGAEVLVNTETSGNQSAQYIDALSGGGYIVVWTDGSALGTDTSGAGIKAQLFDADGIRVGGEFLVNTTLPANQITPRVSTLASGRFVVTWTDQSGLGGDASQGAIKGQLFEANGTKVGSEFLVNTVTTADQSAPRITELQGGGFVIGWQDQSHVGGDASSIGLKAQIFDANAVPVGGEFLVNTFTTGAQTTLEMIPLASGGFVASWLSNGIKYQLFDSSGAKVGSEAQANVGTPFSVSGPDIAKLGSGFVMIWAEQQTSGSTLGLDLKGQLFDDAGQKVGSAFDVNGAETGDQRTADVQALPGGGFIVSWQSVATTGNLDDVWAQVFDASGAKVGTEFIATSVVSGSQTAPKLTVLNSGDIVLTWTDNSGVGGDASGNAVKSQILTLATDGPSAVALSTTTVSETAIDNFAMATLSATGAINSSFTYTLLADTSGGAFRIDGDKLVVDDNHKLDFETNTSVQVTVRATDLNGNSHDEILTLNVADAAIEQRYSAGAEIAAPTPTGDFQGGTHIAALANGNHLVTWENIGSSPAGFRGQLYDASGAAIGSEFAASDGTRASDRFAIVALPGGGFITFYEGDSIDLNPGNAFPINAQIFDAAGAPVGGQILVSTTNQGILSDPDAALLGNGNVVAVWALPVDENGGAFGSQVVAQILDAAGNKVGGEFRVNTQTVGSQGAAHVAALSGGGFLVTWTDDDTQGFNAQLFTNGGVKIGSQFDIASDGPNAEDGNIAALQGGGFVVVLGSENGTTHQIEAHLFNAAGTQIADFLVLAPQDLNNVAIGTPHVASLPGGGFVVSWSTSLNADQTSFLTAQLFDGSGHVMGNPFRVEDAGENAAEESLATTSDGDILLSWVHGFRDSAGNPKSDVQSRTFSSTDILGTTGDDILVATSGDDDMHGFGGNDGFAFGANFTAADRVDGGEGNNDQIGLQGDYTGAHALTLGPGTITGIEAIVVLPGFSYDITTNDGNVAAGGLLKVQATQLAAGQSLHFDGSAEHDGSFLVFGGNGDDVMIGGDKDDGFFFGPGQFTGADVVNGGPGGNDQLGLDGDYGSVGSPLVLGGNITNVEVVVLLPGPAGTPNHFNLTTADAFVPSGETRTIFALQTTTGITFDGSHEHDGAFKVYGGTGADTITGSDGDDWIFGGNGGDTLTGGAGADTFYYDAVGQSTSTGFDRLIGFDDAADRIDLPFAVTGFAGPVSGDLSNASFDSDLSSAFAGLTSHQAGMFTATGGDMAGRSFLVVDADGVQGYQAGSDYVIEIVNPTTPVDNPAIFV